MFYDVNEDGELTGSFQRQNDEGTRVWKENAEVRKTTKAQRDAALEKLTHDFGDGRVIQVRPSDEANFKRAYQIFTLTGDATIDWVMADNVKHPVTEAELRTAQAAGLLKGKAVWDAYTPRPK